jgi:PHD/YefM family antitoxin component YafN of YafNO toxin-antitoxin module
MDGNKKKKGQNRYNLLSPEHYRKQIMEMVTYIENPENLKKINTIVERYWIDEPY